MKINMGCGRTVLDGWFNIDAVVNERATRPPELLSDIRKLDLPDGCAEEIMAIHVWEHINRWECEDTIAEWRRLMAPQARLVLEMPDVVKCCRNVVQGRKGHKAPEQMGLWGLYGDPKGKESMRHAWGWTFKTLEPFLSEAGFDQIVEVPTQFHEVGRLERDFRIEARKA